MMLRVATFAWIGRGLWRMRCGRYPWQARRRHR
jgi:hypothetical protein